MYGPFIFNEMSARRNEDGSKTLVRGELPLHVNVIGDILVQEWLSPLI